MADTVQTARGPCEGKVQVGPGKEERLRSWGGEKMNLSQGVLCGTSEGQRIAASGRENLQVKDPLSQLRTMASNLGGLRSLTLSEEIHVPSEPARFLSGRGFHPTSRASRHPRTGSSWREGGVDGRKGSLRKVMERFGAKNQ